MNLTIYELALDSATTLMLFISIILICGPVPYVKERKRYKQSRTCIGVAILILALNYSVHLFINPRFHGHEDWAVVVNLCTYVAVVPLFYCALMQLMVQDFNLKFNKKKAAHIAFGASFTALMVIAMKAFPDKRNVTLIIGAGVFCAYSSGMGTLLFICYRRLLRLIDETQSEDMEPYVRWMSFITFFIIIYGPLCGICTFLPAEYTYIWVLSSIPMYIYIFFAYKNYLLFDEKVADVEPESAELPEQQNADLLTDEAVLSDYYKQRDAFMAKQVKEWIDDLGFTEQGVTLTSLAAALNTNRTYLGGFMKRSQTKPFREWINDLRINYAKTLMSESPLIQMTEVASRCGYSTVSHFTTTFTRNVGVSPSKWNKLNNGFLPKA